MLIDTAVRVAAATARLPVAAGRRLGFDQLRDGSSGRSRMGLFWGLRLAARELRDAVHAHIPFEYARHFRLEREAVAVVLGRVSRSARGGGDLGSWDGPRVMRCLAGPAAAVWWWGELPRALDSVCRRAAKGFIARRRAGARHSCRERTMLGCFLHAQAHGIRLERANGAPQPLRDPRTSRHILHELQGPVEFGAAADAELQRCVRRGEEQDRNRRGEKLVVENWDATVQICRVVQSSEVPNRVLGQVHHPLGKHGVVGDAVGAVKNWGVKPDTNLLLLATVPSALELQSRDIPG